MLHSTRAHKAIRMVCTTWLTTAPFGCGKCSLRTLTEGGAHCIHAASSGACVKDMTMTKPTVSYVLSRMSVQAKYHHLSTQLGRKFVLYTSMGSQISAAQPASMPEHSNNSQVSCIIRYSSTPCHKASG